MANATLSPNLNKFGPGIIRLASVGTAVPALTAVASVFTNAWAGWIAVGGTESGMTLTDNPGFADMVAAESFYPSHIIQNSADAAFAFTLNEVNKKNLAFAMNGGDSATLTGSGGSFAASGSTTTKVSGFSKPLIGKNTDCMFSWVSTDGDECVIAYDCINIASIALAAGKAPAHRELAFNLRSVLPSSNPDTNLGYGSTDLQPYRYYFAGALFD